MRHFPPPWTAEITPNCFIVRDAEDQPTGLRLATGKATAWLQGCSDTAAIAPRLVVGMRRWSSPALKTCGLSWLRTPQGPAPPSQLAPKATWPRASPKSGSIGMTSRRPSERRPSEPAKSTGQDGRHSPRQWPGSLPSSVGPSPLSANGERSADRPARPRSRACINAPRRCGARAADRSRARPSTPPCRRRSQDRCSLFLVQQTTGKWVSGTTLLPVSGSPGSA